jgi:hypothetical protein
MWGGEEAMRGLIVVVVLLLAGAGSGCHPGRGAAGRTDVATRHARESALSPEDTALLESAVEIARSLRPSTTAAALMASAAVIYRRVDEAAAGRLAAEAAESLHEAEALTGSPRHSLEFARYVIASDISGVDAELGLAVADSIEGPGFRELARAMAAYRCQASDPTISARIRDGITDAVLIITAQVGAWTADGLRSRLSSVQAWSELQSALPYLSEIDDPYQRVRYLAFFGACARQLGHADAWDRRFLPELRALIESYEAPEERLELLEQSLLVETTADPELLALGEKAIAASSMSDAERALWLARVRSFVDLRAGLRIVESMPSPLYQASALFYVLRNSPGADARDSHDALEIARSLSKSLPSTRPGPRLLRAVLAHVARYHPEECLLIASQGPSENGGPEQKAAYAQVLEAVAVSHPAIALKHLDTVHEPELRARLVLRALRSKLGELASDLDIMVL